jgi:hypothetical protein
VLWNGLLHTYREHPSALLRFTLTDELIVCLSKKVYTSRESIRMMKVPRVSEPNHRFINLNGPLYINRLRVFTANVVEGKFRSFTLFFCTCHNDMYPNYQTFAKRQSMERTEFQIFNHKPSACSLLHSTVTSIDRHVRVYARHTAPHKIKVTRLGCG